MSTKSKPLSLLLALKAAEFYGVSEAALRNWRRMGLAANDPFPMDYPLEVLQWYGRHHTKGVPDRLLQAVRRWERGGKA